MMRAALKMATERLSSDLVAVNPGASRCDASVGIQLRAVTQPVCSLVSLLRSAECRAKSIRISTVDAPAFDRQIAIDQRQPGDVHYAKLDVPAELREIHRAGVDVEIPQPPVHGEELVAACVDLGARPQFWFGHELTCGFGVEEA